MLQFNFTDGNIETERFDNLPGTTQDVIATLTRSLNSQASLLFTVGPSLSSGRLWRDHVVPSASSSQELSVQHHGQICPGPRPLFNDIQIPKSSSQTGFWNTELNYSHAPQKGCTGA